MAIETQVFLNDLDDITAYITDIPPIAQTKAPFGQFITNDISSFQGENSGGFWDSLCPYSAFYGQGDISVNKITIYQNGLMVFHGNIKSIVTNDEDNTAMVNVGSVLQDFLDNAVRIVSDVISTPSEVIALLCGYYGVPFDPNSFAKSTALYETFNIQVSVNLALPTMSGMELLTSMAEKGLARVYGLNGTLYFEAYDPTSLPDSTYMFSDAIDNPDGCTIIQSPERSDLEKERIQGYSVETMGGTVNFGNPNLAGKQISGSGESPVLILTAPTGIWIGDRWYYYLNLSEQQVTFGVPPSIGRNLQLNEVVQLENTFRDWPILTIEIVSLDNSDDTQTLLTGVTSVF